MSFRHVKSLVLACSGAAALLGATLDANAGGLAVREQSAYGQGSSYAGVAAGGSLSSMFYNPATITQVQGINSESTVSGILPYSANTPAAGTPFGALGGTGNVDLAALVPASYYSWQVNQQLWLGLSVNAPFGLQEQLPDLWAGRNYGAGGQNMASYNFTPTFAFKINDWISVGAGVQIQYATATFNQGIIIPPATQVAGGQLGIHGSGYGYGFTAGVTLTPTPTTIIGLGWRSAINQKLSGEAISTIGAFGAFTPGSVTTTVNLPDIVSLGLRQKLTSQWTAMATVEWSNWSRIGTVNILDPTGAPKLSPLGTPMTIPFQWSNGWFVALGGEYQWDPQWALRAGVAYEKSPVTDQVRIPALPDDDRFWLSAGATYKWSPKITLDFAYSHVFVKNAPINDVAGNPFFAGTGGAPYTGSVSSHIDIVSLALRYRWDDPAPEPIKQRYSKAK
ncbi:MAG: OmpP1/FadL family transporter [Pseudolabrys sp.]